METSECDWCGEVHADATSQAACDADYVAAREAFWATFSEDADARGEEWRFWSAEAKTPRGIRLEEAR